jgi:cation diffusion facilitator CzcD-associated flavoprotein CzcO
MGTDSSPIDLDPDEPHYDVIIVGAGMGGIYGVFRFRQLGLRVLGLEGASGVGGVWYHNRYPGARVDVESLDYSYYFSKEIWEKWRWEERFAPQEALLEYLNFVADLYDIKRHFLFDTPMTGAQWDGEQRRYHVTAGTGQRFSCQFLVMATGMLSAARRPDFPGLERFGGEWVETSHWPARDMALDGRRIGVIGTGSSGVQVIPVLAEQAAHLFVFQRTANYSVPASNAPIGPEIQDEVVDNIEELREMLLADYKGSRPPRGQHPLEHYSKEEQLELLERQWARGGQSMNSIFSDQGTTKRTNDVVAEFVRSKVRSIVRDPELAEMLSPRAYPIGTRRLILDTGYYETYNRDNVTLVDIRREPIEEITETGIRTAAGHYELDLIVFALGFHAFRGAIDQANIRNEEGRAPTDSWTRGPRTMLGLMMTGFPNFFTPCGAGSPSVLANLFLQNEFHIDWIADCIAFVMDRGYSTVEPTEEAVDEWTAHVSETASRLLRLQVDNYMVHVNEDDGSRVFMPYTGGLGQYVRRAREIAAAGYEGFAFR